MVDASLAYEILMYLNSFYFGLLAFVELGVFIYKLVKLGKRYSLIPTTLIWDVGYLFGTTLLETIRIYLGRKSSLSKHGWQVIVSVILTFPCMAGIWYLIYFQEVSIQLEIILCALELMLQFTEIVYATIFTITACRPRTYT
ncbi:uncharacterized protein LOC129570523 [Sitodiplosis mosellana]|uniref:uncharacterized protein LOC129570523 n=1 Tax=Sitodiplosis mosellana TaxID=263140 RepID=UPI00244430A8|nr:uncharacterized protein LOC129570523 [Sitodiplosis mosellana]XP_055306147.1 uncharacterized protein LOC129570523 [Sitodiplosis mosellana]